MKWELHTFIKMTPEELERLFRHYVSDGGRLSDDQICTLFALAREAFALQKRVELEQTSREWAISDATSKLQ